MAKSVEKFGLEINNVGIGELLFNKTMIIAYILLAIGLWGIVDIFHLRFFGGFADTYAAINNLGSAEVAESLKHTIFGHGGEINKNEPWGLFVANYMFMLYTGSAMILLVAIAELLHMKNIEKIAPLFAAFGLAMVLGGMFTIAMDWGNPLNLYWMFLDAHPSSGMWMMLPLYMIYIPFTIIEIYFMITTNREKARKVAGILVIVGILIELAEFYIQSNLFALNTPRHLWNFDALQPLYLVITGFTAALGVMAILSSIVLKDKSHYSDTMDLVRKGAIIWIIILGLYELYAGTMMPAAYKENIANGLFGNWFMIGYVAIGSVLPLLLLIKKSNTLTMLASVLLIIGAYINRYIFVYGGNSVPMTDRAGTGFQADRAYESAAQVIYIPPHLAEVAIVFGSFGVALLLYKFADTLLSFSKERAH
jgi:Ni/Fe-hydrogenase subunit HybB-like protein